MKQWWREHGWLARLALLTWPVALVGLTLTIWLLPDFEHRGSVGCFWTDAMLPYVRCHGTEYDEGLGYVLGYPLYWLFFFWAYAPVGLFVALVWFRPEGLLALPLGVFWYFCAWQLITFACSPFARSQT